MLELLALLLLQLATLGQNPPANNPGIGGGAWGEGQATQTGGGSWGEGQANAPTGGGSWGEGQAHSQTPPTKP